MLEDCKKIWAVKVKKLANASSQATGLDQKMYSQLRASAESKMETFKVVSEAALAFHLQTVPNARSSFQLSRYRGPWENVESRLKNAISDSIPRIEAAIKEYGEATEAADKLIRGAIL